MSVEIIAMNREQAEELVEVIFGFFYDRKGFDHWWSSIDKKTQEALKDELALRLIYETTN